jgi:CheY-like chemotaxis protein
MPTRERPCIALINDDTTFLTLMHDLLEDTEGYEVMYCKESDGAYQFVKDHRPDLVILDIRMGGEEAGWNILELLTLDPETKPIPVIVCSAAVRQLHDHAVLLEQYGVEVLPKPFDLDALLEKVTAALALGHRPSEG